MSSLNTRNGAPKGGLYMILNFASWRMYVDVSTNIAENYREHTKLLKKGTHPIPAMQADWNRYGAKMFRCLTISSTDRRTTLLRWKRDIVEPFHAQRGSEYRTLH